MEKGSGFIPAPSSFFFNLEVVMDMKEEKVRIRQLFYVELCLKKKKSQHLGVNSDSLCGKNILEVVTWLIGLYHEWK